MSAPDRVTREREALAVELVRIADEMHACRHGEGGDPTREDFETTMRRAATALSTLQEGGEQPDEQWPMMQRDPSAPQVAGPDPAMVRQALGVLNANGYVVAAQILAKAVQSGAPPVAGIRETEALKAQVAELEGVVREYGDDPGYARSRFVELDRLRDQRAHDRLKIDGLEKEVARLRAPAPGTGGEEGINSALVHLDDLRRLLPAREWADEAHSLVDTLTAEIEALRAPSGGKREPGDVRCPRCGHMTRGQREGGVDYCTTCGGVLPAPPEHGEPSDG